MKKNMVLKLLTLYYNAITIFYIMFWYVIKLSDKINNSNKLRLENDSPKLFLLLSVLKQKYFITFH